MGRHASGTWSERRQLWYVRLTEPGGTRREVPLRDPDGRLVERSDVAGAREAARRVVAERDAAIEAAPGPR